LLIGLSGLVGIVVVSLAVGTALLLGP